jgi:hypothetical protein
MDDVKFLQQCGIEIDLRWLVEFLGHDAPPEICNYINGLMRISDMLGQVPIRGQVG